MRTPTMLDKRVINSFLNWFEALTPQDRERWMRLMTRVVKQVKDDYGL